MANALYTLGKQALIGTIDLSGDTIKAALVSSAYTPNLATDQFYNPAINGSIIGTDQTLGSKTITNGVFDAADATWTAVAGGSTVKYVAIYKDTGTPTTSPLILLIDTTTGVTLPISTNGGDITMQWDNGSNRIFALT